MNCQPKGEGGFFIVMIGEIKGNIFQEGHISSCPATDWDTRKVCRWIEALKRLGMQQTGLHRLRTLLELLDNPHARLPCVHVAGTNGKGSTCTIIANALAAGGYRTGLFTSPYLSDFRESMAIDGRLMDDVDFVDIGRTVLQQIELLESQGVIISEFECNFAMAMLWFMKKECDIVVLETGLGGREDATNVIPPPLVCAFTAISLDHTTILGSTVEEITTQKCGIIKSGSTVVALVQQDPRALFIIENTSQQSGNELICFDLSLAHDVELDTGGIQFAYPDPDNGFDLMLRVDMPGAHQLQNATLALGVLYALRKRGFDVEPKRIQEGFAQTQLRARVQTIRRKPLVLLDGGHNREGVEALVSVLAQYTQHPKIGIIGMLADKPYAQALQSLSGVLDEIYTVNIESNTRSLCAQDLASAAIPYGREVHAFASKEDALAAALACIGKDGLLVVCGSLYLAGEFWPLLEPLQQTL